jgi:transposase
LVDTYLLGDTGPRKEECIVPRTRAAYPPEFRRQIIELVRAGRTLGELAEEFEPTAQTIRNWANQDRVDAGECPGLAGEEREELAWLRRPPPPAGTPRGRARPAGRRDVDFAEGVDQVGEAALPACPGQV